MACSCATVEYCCWSVDIRTYCAAANRRTGGGDNEGSVSSAGILRSPYEQISVIGASLLKSRCYGDIWECTGDCVGSACLRTGELAVQLNRGVFPCSPFISL